MALTEDDLAEIYRHEAEVKARFDAQAQRIAELEAERDRLHALAEVNEASQRKLFEAISLAGRRLGGEPDAS